MTRLFIADTDTGIVTLRGQLDYEQSTRHAIVAQAMSSDGSAPTTAAFIIDVTNVNEITLDRHRSRRQHRDSLRQRRR